MLTLRDVSKSSFSPDLSPMIETFAPVGVGRDEIGA